MLVGEVSARSGPLLAASSSFDATISGKGGHAAMPQLSIDPIVATSSVVLSLQQLVSREANPLVPQVIFVHFLRYPMPLPTSLAILGLP